MRLSASAKIAVCLELLVSLGAIPAAALTLSDPSGARMGSPVSMLEHSPFTDFFWPALILLTVNGLFPLVAVALVLRRNPWAPRAVAAQGVLLAGWIVVQCAMIRSINALHVIFFAVGVAVALCGWRLLIAPPTALR